MPQTNVARGPLDHYDVLDTDRCRCVVCEPWFSGRVAVEVIVAVRPPHPPTCHCPECQPTHLARFEFQAINTRRDLWIEMSYHASLHTYGPTYMDWLAAELKDQTKTTGWWANAASRHPLSYWFDRFEAAVQTGAVAITGAVTGAFNFVAYYLDVEPEGGGLASLSSLHTDDVAFEPDESKLPEAPRVRRGLHCDFEILSQEEKAKRKRKILDVSV